MAAYVRDVAINVAGDVMLEADSAAVLNVTVSNAAKTTASAIYGAVGISTGGVLASNVVSAKAESFIDYTASLPGQVLVGGRLRVAAQDRPSVLTRPRLRLYRAEN